ncbi:SRPBCC family protein [Sporosarcina thermotolerans]|uniref:SRPBCC family protein n=1 Tax=Sporosarcina thermotolerans TaxID=633404 RepID=A0AAW9A8J2_9BACL|nr:SRPBCC family protein [Sporosarcina thermotolerans]MDW0117762.1 SRPBCC family protein [Sporosarcina thermotolerans]WHT49154.1 SRPBCC family protein [Sporosarcina thermotolerans]
MPSGTHSTELDLPIKKIWDFVSDMNRWAPLVPGYIEHTILSNTQSTWTFKGDIGIVQKTVKLQIDVTEWREPSLVTFDLKGVHDNFVGNGHFKADATSNSTTLMHGNLDIAAKGVMGPMINAILKSFIPKTVEEFTNAVAEEITNIELKRV